MTLNFFHFSSTVCALRVFSFSINNFITEMNETTELGKKRLCTFSPSLNYAHNCQREVGPRTRGMAFSMRLLMRSLEVTWCPQATCWWALHKSVSHQSWTSPHMTGVNHHKTFLFHNSDISMKTDLTSQALCLLLLSVSWLLSAAGNSSLWQQKNNTNHLWYHQPKCPNTKMYLTAP